MTPRKFRFGITAARFGSSQEQWLEFARKAEGMGYSILLMPDHFGPQLAPLLGLVAAAGVTSSLRFGTLVLDNDYRYPTMLAKEAASVDMLTGGRFELGLGAGWMEEEYKQADIPFHPAGARIDRLTEAISIIKQSFKDGPVTFQGKHYNVQGPGNLPQAGAIPYAPVDWGRRPAHADAGRPGSGHYWRKRGAPVGDRGAQR